MLHHGSFAIPLNKNSRLYIWLVFTSLKIDCVMLWWKFCTGTFLSDRQLCYTSLYAISLHYSTICSIWKHQRRYKSNTTYGALTWIYVNFFLIFTPLSPDLSDLVVYYVFILVQIGLRTYALAPKFISILLLLQDPSSLSHSRCYCTQCSRLIRRVFDNYGSVDARNLFWSFYFCRNAFPTINWWAVGLDSDNIFHFLWHL